MPIDLSIAPWLKLQCVTLKQQRHKLDRLWNNIHTIFVFINFTATWRSETQCQVNSVDEVVGEVPYLL